MGSIREFEPCIRARPKGVFYVRKGRVEVELEYEARLYSNHERLKVEAEVPMCRKTRTFESRFLSEKTTF